MKKKGLFLFLLALGMVIVSLIWLSIFGHTYYYEVELNNNNVNSIEDLNISVKNLQKKEAVKIVKKEYKNNIVKIKLISLNKGKAIIDIDVGDYSHIEVFYVHPLGIISKNFVLGKTRGDIIIPIMLIIYILVILVMLIKDYRINIKKCLYQYKNILSLGLIIFLSFILIDTIAQLFNYGGLYDSVNDLLNSVGNFAFILLPIAFILSILVTISNIRLMIREGRTWKNMLGTILGCLFIILTITPEILNSLSYNSILIDVHNSQGIATYVLSFVNTLIYTIVAYLEAILLGTIIIAIKSAKHVPKFNKDYIIILGCMIRKDGSLTPLLKSRVDKAIEFAKLQKDKTGKGIVFVPSGGQGKNEIMPEGEAMKNYLLDQGIDKKDIIVEDKSKNTYENIKFSKALIDKKNKKANIAFATNNYHVFRSGIIAGDQNIDIEGIGSKTKFYFWINAFIREFIATLYSERKNNIKIMFIILILSIVMILVTYYCNIL